MAQFRTLFLLNAKSRRGKDQGEALRSELEKHGMSVVNQEDFDPKDFASTIERFAGSVDLVPVAGGDGSMNAALEGLLKTKLPLAVIPLGTSNNLARNLGIPLDPVEAIAGIQKFSPGAIDLGTVNSIPFLIVAGVGISTHVNQIVEPAAKRRFGMFAYIGTAIRAFRDYKPFRAEIEIEGEADRCVRSLQISVCNGRFFGSGLKASDEATVQDEKLHLCSIQVHRWTQIPHAIFGIKTGQHTKQAPTVLLESSKFSIRTSRPRRIDVDGEIRTQTPATFGVLPKAIRVLVPT